mmetsp:Transcript_36421/g.62550  ORF Transcript_36421/g.62550 Transcript_36421/m.62550 type:complete len:138 (+) Transcript_36421:359-772(+)
MGASTLARRGAARRAGGTYIEEAALVTGHACSQWRNGQQQQAQPSCRRLHAASRSRQPRRCEGSGQAERGLAIQLDLLATPSHLDEKVFERTDWFDQLAVHPVEGSVAVQAACPTSWSSPFDDSAARRTAPPVLGTR